MTVWVVSLEWNVPPSDVTGDTGIVGVFETREDAELASVAERVTRDGQGEQVHGFTMHEGRYCGACGELTTEGTHAGCGHRDDDPDFCDGCGAELRATGSCDNDHDEWDVDVHVSEHQVHPPEAIRD